MKTPACLLVLALSCAALHHSRADDLEGADAILKQIVRNAPGATQAADGDSPGKLRADIQAFGKTVLMLPPDEAVKGWLDLADRFSKFPAKVLNSGSEMAFYRFDFTNLVAVLPPPAAWPALVKAVEARPVDGNEAVHVLLLRLIAHRLVNDDKALNKDFADLQVFLEKKGPKPDHLNVLVYSLRTMAPGGSQNDADVLKQFDQSISQPAHQGQPVEIRVPDLVALAGREKAAGLLGRALRSDVVIDAVSGDETMDIARKLALENAADLKRPQWGLARSIDSTALFEAMMKQFPDSVSGGSSPYLSEAQSYYLLGLVAAHRTKEAVAFAAKLGNNGPLPEEAITALERAGHTADLADFFHDRLSQNPDFPYWSEYAALAVQAGHEDKMVALSEASLTRSGLSEEKRRQIEEYLRRAYLATDRVDKGIAILRNEIAGAKNGDWNTPRLSPCNHCPWTSAGPAQLGLELARLGAALDRKDLFDEGIQAIKNTPTNRADDSLAKAGLVAGLLIKQGRAPEAEAVLKDALIAVSQEYYESPMCREDLALLMDIYDHANRPADVLAILDRAPFWDAKDLADVVSQSVEIDHNKDYAGYFAADALAASGRKAEARKVLEALLDQQADYDPAYELLIKIAPRDEVLVRLDALFARDKYEPRPLIWKAKILLDAGKLEEAEAAARQAIAIDPSDGLQGPGRRMRAYAVLADICEARGDKKDAELYRGAITAIRHAEDGDRFFEAGLTTRAIKIYEESLTHFADAYCIHTRLAARMAEVGDMAGAEEHYRRAYELMPDSFGRVDSDCLGCEGVFEEPFAQIVGEKVFTDLAKKQPGKPQVHYLLGYLLKEEGNYTAALTEFREAVKLDPDYLSAWNMISNVGTSDSVELTIVRLDPLGRHSYFYPGYIIDLAATWNALEDASKLRPVKAATLYPMVASAQEVERRKAERTGNFGWFTDEAEDTSDFWGRYRRPRSVIGYNAFIQAVARTYSNAETPAGQ